MRRRLLERLGEGVDVDLVAVHRVQVEVAAGVLVRLGHANETHSVAREMRDAGSDGSLVLITNEEREVLALDCRDQVQRASIGRSRERVRLLDARQLEATDTRTATRETGQGGPDGMIVG